MGTIILGSLRTADEMSLGMNEGTDIGSLNNIENVLLMEPKTETKWNIFLE